MPAVLLFRWLVQQLPDPRRSKQNELDVPLGKMLFASGGRVLIASGIDGVLHFWGIPRPLDDVREPPVARG